MEGYVLEFCACGNSWKVHCARSEFLHTFVITPRCASAGRGEVIGHGVSANKFICIFEILTFRIKSIQTVEGLSSN